jgi:hypothetical protein
MENAQLDGQVILISGGLDTQDSLARLALVRTHLEQHGCVVITPDDINPEDGTFEGLLVGVNLDLEVLTEIVPRPEKEIDHMMEMLAHESKMDKMLRTGVIEIRNYHQDVGEISRVLRKDCVALPDRDFDNRMGARKKGNCRKYPVVKNIGHRGRQRR